MFWYFLTFWMKFLDCICLLSSVREGKSLSDFTSPAAARLTLVIMGRTPHRGRPSQCCFSGCPVTVDWFSNVLMFFNTNLILKQTHKDQNALWCFPSFESFVSFEFLVFGMFEIYLIFSHIYYTCRFYVFILTVIAVCVSVAPKSWWAVQSSFDFRSKRGEGQTKQHHSRICPRQIKWLATLWSLFLFIPDPFINGLIWNFLS